ncbi:MAG: radical SAM protein [Lentisphaerae bacterium]|jgi:putative pyruvate formate lyase activating enzyme|nr:radical SAM protein [Lentisphaerota bacterium]
MFPEYSHCQLCPRRCGANRLQGQLGVCGESAQCRIASITPHFGEEPCLSGTNGSGTIFFSGCSCGCLFCQNFQISHGHQGDLVTQDELLYRVIQLCKKGVHNLNFVTPDHWWPHIRFICNEIRKANLDIPFVWNTSGYSSLEQLREQTQLIDIFLPDFKFSDPALARRCMGDSDYPKIARDAIRLMADKVGFLRPWDTTGDMTATHGMMVRHLVLPGFVQNSLQILDWLAEDFGDAVPISLMSQFTPVPECSRQSFLDRTLAHDEYKQVCQRVGELGFRRVYIQDLGGDSDFMPDFNENQPFPGNLKH